jgi:FdhD protein
MSADSLSPGIASTTLFRVQPGSGSWSRCEDRLAVEEPLEIRLGDRSLSITMRTPGHDLELAAGFLLTEGIIQGPEEVSRIAFCGASGNVVRAELRDGVSVDLKRLERHFYTSSSCGVCGKSSIDALRVSVPEAARSSGPMLVRSSVILELPERLRRSQGLFDTTGGMHASALFDPDGELLLLREDVGRHNALDKLIGHELLEKRLPLGSRILLVSGRASFELVQKAAVAGIPVLAAVGAPSSLAVALAREAGMTLIGFLRDGRFNIYCGEDRMVK